MPRTRTEAFDVEVGCRLCGARHGVRGTAEIARQPIVFGGGGATTTATALAWTGPVTCPVEHRVFEGQLLIPAQDGESLRGVEILDVEPVAARPTETGPPPAPAPASPADDAAARDWIDEELADWRTSSVANARTFATTMLATSTGGVPLYFAVLNYLGWKTAHAGSALATLSILPPVLLFGAAGLFTLALHPALVYVDRSEYATFRERRIRQMHARATAAASLFGLGLLVSIAVFFVLLQRGST